MLLFARWLGPCCSMHVPPPVPARPHHVPVRAHRAVTVEQFPEGVGRGPGAQAARAGGRGGSKSTGSDKTVTTTSLSGLVDLVDEVPPPPPRPPGRHLPLQPR